MISIKEMNVAKNSMPADALISLSFKTRNIISFYIFSKLYKLIHFFIFYRQYSAILIQE